MDTPRTVIKIDKNTPGTEITAEIVAALAAASLVFRKTDPTYSKLLVKRAISVNNYLALIIIINIKCSVNVMVKLNMLEIDPLSV